MSKNDSGFDPTTSTYQNLDLEIEAHDGAYRAHVINSPVGQVNWTPFSLPFSPKELQQARALFGQVRNLRPIASSEPPLDPKQFGVQLYKSVFGGAIGECLSRSLERVGSETGLRIRLRLNNAPDLADLPWEYLCAPPPHDFFALSARTPIVRYLATSSAETPLLATLPLRILVVIANPATPDAPALDVEVEWDKLQTALGDLLRRGLVVLERLAAPTLDALRQRLRTSTEKPPIHLLHFIGHGATGVLLFEDATGNPHRVAAEMLGTILREHRWLRLVFLNACEGGRSSEQDIFNGVAPQLVEKEVPAVIAMKYAVSDRAAIDLATCFYEAIADGYPVDAALAEARKAVFVDGNPYEWATPVLFSRSSDNQLLAKQTDREQGDAMTQQTIAINTESINTEGGAVVQGNVNIANGDFVGRDRIVHGDHIQGDKVLGDKVQGDKITVGNITGNTGVAIGRGAQAIVNQNTTPLDLNALFAPLRQTLQQLPTEKQATALQKVSELQQEAAKGEHADDSRLAKLISGLVKHAPDAVSSVVSLFTTSALGKVAGNTTKFVLEQIQEE